MVSLIIIIVIMLVIIIIIVNFQCHLTHLLVPVGRLAIRGLVWKGMERKEYLHFANIPSSTDAKRPVVAMLTAGRFCL